MREYIIKVMNDEPLSALKAGETIQAVMKTSGDCDELVRCKDCAGWNEEEQHSCTDGMEANDYCSHAEHKKRTIEERLKRYKNRSEENGE